MNRALLIILVAAASGAIAIGALAQDASNERAGKGPDKFFEKNDADSDGKVTLAELVASAKKLMKELDTDEDGAITKKELAAARKERPDRQSEGDGERVRPDERRGPPEGGRRGGGGGEGRERPSAEDMFKRLDTDGDGSVSLEEFKAGAPERGPRGGGRR